jgi:hypothetical protein
MTWTIRDGFKLRKRRTTVAVSVGVAVSAVAVVCVGEFAGRRAQVLLLAVAVIGLMIIFAGLLYLDKTRCPRCLGRIGPGLFMGTSINFCPHCGASLDAQAP